MNILKLDNEAEIVKLFTEWGYGYAILDTETTDLDPFRASVISYTLATPSGDNVFFIVGDKLHLLNHLHVPLVCHNFKYDFNVCYRNGVDLRKQGLHHDTMLLDHLLNEENDHDLDSIVKRYFNDNYKEVFWGKYKDIQEAPEADLIEYSGKDAGYTAKVFSILNRDLNIAGIPHTLIDHARKFALALYDTEIKGLRIDLPYLNDMGVTLSQNIRKLLDQIRSTADIECSSIELQMYEIELGKRKTLKGKMGVKRPDFNFSSNLQLSHLLYDALQLPERKNKSGNRTVDDEALASLEDLHPIVPSLRKYRELHKVKTAFIDGTLEKMKGSRVYPSFNVNGTVTGRISSSNPNMQQLPTSGGVRGIYIPDAGMVFLSYDYSQLEVTIAAHFSRDKNLLRIINEGVSQHDITAEGLGIPRQTAKTINFALQYGAGAQKVQKILGGTLKEAEDALRRYWDTYSGLRDFITDCHKKIEIGAPLVNPFGRIRHLPTKAQMDAKWGDEGWFSRAEKKYVYKRDIYWSGVLRQGPNSLIQGTGADITNTAFRKVDYKLKQLGIGYGLFPIHDELLVCVKEDAVDVCSQIMQTEMVTVGDRIGLTVPLKADGGKPMKRWEKG